MPGILVALELYDRDELNQVEQLLVNVLPEARQTRTPHTLIISHILMARLALARGDCETWQRFLVELERFGQQSGSLRIQCSVWLERARVATLRKHLDVAQLALQSAQSVSAWEPFEGRWPAGEVDNLLIAYQRLRIAQGNYNAAVEDLLVAIGNAQANQPLRLQIKLHLLLAMAQDGRKCSRLAMQAFGQALRLAGDEGLLRSFIDEGEPVAGLLQRWVSRRCGQGDQAINPQFVAQLLQRLGIGNRSTALTERETQVLQLLAFGHRNRVIAQRMFLSECTVKTHLHRINVKLGARSRSQALAIARFNGWLE
ncbi:Transcriptional regulatory protein DegU [compost metagenome]